MIAGRTFIFRPMMSIASLISLVILLSLGAWQLQRLEWKRDLLIQVEARVSNAPISLAEALNKKAASEVLEYTPVALEGEYLRQGEVRLFSAHEGEPGVLLFSPLRVSETRIIYINRGFVPQSEARKEGASFPLPKGPAQVSGLWREQEVLTPPSSWFRTKGQLADGLWLVRDPVAFGDIHGFQAESFYLDVFAQEKSDRFPIGGLTRLEFNNRHLEYALTWFGLAATLIGVWFAASLRKS